MERQPKLRLIDEQKETIQWATEVTGTMPASDIRAEIRALIAKSTESIMLIENSWEEGKPFSFKAMMILQQATQRIKDILK